MGRAPCCDKAKVKKGPWSPEEDAKLKSHIQNHGTGDNWITLPSKIGLKRCGKSCRLRWLNYLRPNLKHGGFTEDEDNLICNLYVTIGSRWSVIAAQLPGRTDNDIKNYWNTRLKKKILGKQRRPHHHPPQPPAAKIAPVPPPQQPPSDRALNMPQLEEYFSYSNNLEANNFQYCAQQHYYNVWENYSPMIDLPSISQVGLMPQLHTAVFTSPSMENVISWEDMNYQPWIVYDEPRLLPCPRLIQQGI